MASRYILKIWQQARSGNAEAQITLAEAYLYGQEGMGRNLSTARRWKAQPDSHPRARSNYLHNTSPKEIRAMQR